MDHQCINGRFVNVIIFAVVLVLVLVLLLFSIQLEQIRQVTPFYRMERTY